MMLLFFVLIKVFNLSILKANICLSAYSLIDLFRTADTTTCDKQGDTAKVLSGITFIVILISNISFINYVNIPLSTIIIYIIYVIIGVCIHIGNDRKK